jgi:hypothetical protein
MYSPNMLNSELCFHSPPRCYRIRLTIHSLHHHQQRHSLQLLGSFSDPPHAHVHFHIVTLIHFTFHSLHHHQHCRRVSNSLSRSVALTTESHQTLSSLFAIKQYSNSSRLSTTHSGMIWYAASAFISLTSFVCHKKDNHLSFVR